MKRALRIAAAAVVLLAVLFVARLYLSIRFGRQPTVDPTLVARSVHQEPALLAEAKALPVARTFPQSLHFQQNGTFCGPASLVNVLASLGWEREELPADRERRRVTAGVGVETRF